MRYGWFIVALAFVIYMTVVGSTFTAFGLFVLPVSQEFQLSRADTNTALIFLNIGQAALAPFVGLLLDRMRLKAMMAISAILFGLSLAALGLSHSLWLSAFVLTVPLAASCLGVAMIALPVLIARWFDERRGTAMVLAATGLSIGAVVVTPAVGWLIELYGWRSTLLIVGTVAGSLMLALILLVRDAPADAGSSMHSPAASQAVGASQTGQLLRMPAFWLIGVSTALATGISQAVVITIVPIAIEAGSTPLHAAGLISVVGIAAISAKLLLSMFADRVDRAWVLTGLIVSGVALNVALLASHAEAVLMGAAALLGITSGVMMPFLHTLLADRFGLKLFGTVQGLSMFLVSIAGAASVRVAGEVFDRTGGYDLLFQIFIVGEVLALAMMLRVALKKPRAPVTDPRPAAQVAT